MNIYFFFDKKPLIGIIIDTLYNFLLRSKSSSLRTLRYYRIIIVRHPRDAVSVHLNYTDPFMCVQRRRRSPRKQSIRYTYRTYLFSCIVYLEPGHDVGQGRDVGWSLGGLLN